jgi:hypothetical protein
MGSPTLDEVAGTFHRNQNQNPYEGRKKWGRRRWMKSLERFTATKTKTPTKGGRNRGRRRWTKPVDHRSPKESESSVGRTGRTNEYIVMR